MVYSVIDEQDNIYSQHSEFDRANDSMFDLIQLFKNIKFSIVTKFNWNEGNKNFPEVVENRRGK